MHKGGEASVSFYFLNESVVILNAEIHSFFVLGVVVEIFFLSPIYFTFMF